MIELKFFHDQIIEGIIEKKIAEIESVLTENKQGYKILKQDLSRLEYTYEMPEHELFHFPVDERELIKISSISFKRSYENSYNNWRKNRATLITMKKVIDDGRSKFLKIRLQEYYDEVNKANWNDHAKKVVSDSLNDMVKYLKDMFPDHFKRFKLKQKKSIVADNEPVFFPSIAQEDLEKLYDYFDHPIVKDLSKNEWVELLTGKNTFENKNILIEKGLFCYVLDKLLNKYDISQSHFHKNFHGKNILTYTDKQYNYSTIKSAKTRFLSKKGNRASLDKFDNDFDV